MHRWFAVVLLLTFTSHLPAEERRLLDWLASLPSHGLSVSHQDWLVLSTSPSPEQLQAITTKYARYLDTGWLERRLYQPGWQIPDIPQLSPEQHRIEINQLYLTQSAIPQYEVLREAMARLQYWLKDAQRLFPDELVIYAGDQHITIPLLNAWLRDLDLAHDLPDDHYSEAHLDALTKVQERYNLGPDGRLGPMTRQALIAITHDRIRTLKVNLERLRWLPRALPEQHVWVDIAGYEVIWVNDGREAGRYRAISGMPNRQTPVFQESIESVTVNPVWKVPHSLAAYDLLRKEKRSPGFLKQEGFRVYESWDYRAPEVAIDRINFQRLTSIEFRYRLEQQPGPENRLGRYKINLPNKLGIYLHDTHKPELFDKNDRSLSSGCTRVQGIEQLVHQIVTPQGLSADWLALKVSPSTEKLVLPQSVPVFFVYFTAWPDATGRVRFRDDIYQLDNALESRF
ncbi:L,D-transpeptidase family protein [Kistimonas asteriae]|uniref:L,D-transpeptidase family protein n=1 Tax=Kistimonas asteriae TaxID=517724 RepID=UPI001BA62396|nr:L,D-transpeptidase family protein [Kistimonas asteriae]